MFMQADTVLEVDGVSKLYSRSQAVARQRVAGVFIRTLMGLGSGRHDKLQSGEFWSLKDISFSLKRGRALGVIGLNGAGKTTLLRLLAGQLLPDLGEIRILGNAAAMIDLTAGFQMTASGRRNIFLRGAMLGRSKEKIASTYEEVIEFAELGDAIDAPVSTYSSGMLMRLAFSIMVAVEPDILFIDEILSVGDFRFRQKCLARIRALREKSAFVLVSHSMADIKLFCDDAIVLHGGKIAFYGEPVEAIKIYEDMMFPPVVSEGKRRADILGPQFHNEHAIRDVEHYWCDAEGRKISEIRTGETLYFRTSFIIDHSPRNLVMGVPVWSDKGENVTGFSTETQEEPIRVAPDRRASFQLEIPDVAFNPGCYLSNLSISDGPEFLYRAANPPLTILQARSRFWGLVTVPYQWRELTGGAAV